jgi:Fe-Mn family superoxide dismutase
VSDEWGSFANMITFFNTQSAKLYGSGWVWLAYNNSTKKLEYRQTEVHDQLTELNSNLTPLLNLDLWEHAFYVDYENRKTDYLSGIW